MPAPSDDIDPSRFSRRSFLKGASVAAVTGSLPAASQPRPPKGSRGELLAKGDHAITLTVNGRPLPVTVEPRTTLLDALRDRADLTGTKRICDRGACGGCTVLLDDQPVNSCMMLAMDAVDRPVRTIEGLAKDGKLHPVQEAFVACDALQCGFCTPGFVMASVACVERRGTPDLATIQHDLAGNLCRCGTYGRIFDAVQQAANAPRAGGGR